MAGRSDTAAAGGRAGGAWWRCLPSAHSWQRFLNFVDSIPLLNFFTQIVNARPKLMGDVTDLLNTLSVVGALIFTLALSAPASVSYDELTAANNRILAAGSKTREWWLQSSFLADESTALDEPSARFAFYASFTVFLTAAQLLGSIITYTYLILSGVRVGDEAQVRQQLAIWFASARWAILLLMALLVLGIVFFFVTFLLLVIIKFPDATVTLLGAAADNSSNVYGRTFIWNVMLIPACFVIAVPLTFARRAVMQAQQAVAPGDAPAAPRDAEEERGGRFGLPLGKAWEAAGAAAND